MLRSKLLFIPLAVTIFSASVFCCCIGDLARAHEKAVSLSHLPACHRQAASEESEPDSHECDCSQMLSLAIQTSTFDMKLTALDFSGLDSFLSQTFTANVAGSQKSIALSQAPPGPFNDPIPLYLQHSNLRL